MVGKSWKKHLFHTLGWGDLAFILKIKTQAKGLELLEDQSSEVTKCC